MDHQHSAHQLALLTTLQKESFDYFIHQANPVNGLIRDKTDPAAPASIAAVGMALTIYPIGVERGFMTRRAALDITLATLRFFTDSEQGTGATATGYKGFYYHFLDMQTGQRAWNCATCSRESASPLQNTWRSDVHCPRSPSASMMPSIDGTKCSLVTCRSTISADR